MAIKRKSSPKKLYIAIILLVILIAATAAVVINATQPTPLNVKVGVHVGDSFTYGIVGTSVLTDLNAVESPGFSEYNQTDYFKITITGVNGTSVSFNTVWRFTNGTEIPANQTIDLSNGIKTDSNGFWAIYAANLNVGALLRPTGFDGLTVNATNTQTYAGSTRERNLWFIENQFFDVNDPTHNTLRDDYTRVYFDKQTGMLVTLDSITYYNNPLKTEAITWTLVSSTVWTVR